MFSFHKLSLFHSSVSDSFPIYNRLWELIHGTPDIAGKRKKNGPSCIWVSVPRVRLSEVTPCLPPKQARHCLMYYLALSNTCPRGSGAPVTLYLPCTMSCAGSLWSRALWAQGLRALKIFVFHLHQIEVWVVECHTTTRDLENGCDPEELAASGERPRTKVTPAITQPSLTPQHALCSSW